MRRRGVLLVTAGALGVLASVAGAETMYSGRVITVSPGQLALDELGVGGAATRRTIELAPSTRTFIARRTNPNDEAGAAWPGAFQALPASVEEIHAGDFVTVTVGDGGGAGLAQTIELVRPTSEGAASPR